MNERKPSRVFSCAGCGVCITIEPDPHALGSIIAKALCGTCLERKLPAGWPEPETYPGEVYITREMIGRYTPEEALAYAAALIRAANEARSSKV